MDGSQHGTGFYQDGPNWYSVIAAPGAVGDSALASGHIGDNEAAVFGTNFTGSSVSFNWRVSCESGYDRLFVYVDGAEVGSITGETGWVSFHKDLPPGTHNVQWAYVKDGSVRSGEDRGMLDNLVLR